MSSEAVAESAVIEERVPSLDQMLEEVSCVDLDEMKPGDEANDTSAQSGATMEGYRLNPKDLKLVKSYDSSNVALEDIVIIRGDDNEMLYLRVTARQGVEVPCERKDRSISGDVYDLNLKKRGYLFLSDTRKGKTVLRVDKVQAEILKRRMTGLPSPRQEAIAA